MFDPKLYREACRELRAPEGKIEEIIAMTEKTNKKRVRPLRTALIAAAAVAMMVVSVAAANPEGVQEFLYNIASIVRVDDYRQDVTTVDGEMFTLYTYPEVSVEERDGRAVLVIDGKDAADITEELKSEGRYTYESVTEESRLVISVEGTAKDWTAAVIIGNPDGPVYTFSSDHEGVKSVGHYFAEEEGADGEAIVETYIVTEGDSAGSEGGAATGIYTTEHEVPRP